MENFVNIQPKFVQAINNAKATNRLGHATLIEGSSKFVLDKAIQYIILSLYCDEPVPCLVCDSCRRIAEDHLSDILIYDLSIEALRKENILKIQKSFSQTAIEAGSKQVYVIKNIELASSIALNSLLKFLEEPMPGVYAIFTTNNTSKVLDTVVSRTNVYRIIPQDINVLVDILYKKFPRTSVDLALQITNDEVFIQYVLESDVFSLFENNISDLILSLTDNNFYLNAYEVLNSLDKEDFRLFLELFYVCMTNPYNLTNYGFSDSVETFILNQPEYDGILDTIISSRLKLETNTNLALILDQFSIELEGKIHENN